MEASLLSNYGLPGIIIIGLVTAVVALYRTNQVLQDQRLTDAKEARDKITEPIEQIARTQEKIVDVLLSGKKRG